VGATAVRGLGETVEKETAGQPPSPERRLLGLLVYSLASILIARYAIIRGEVNG